MMKRRRLDAEQSRAMILDAVERLMQRQGYAVVNTRSVASEAGVSPTLVHYHFATTENLLLAAYRRSAERSETILAGALRSDQPLRALWEYNCDGERTVLATQFMALANLWPVIQREMAAFVLRHRRMQAAVLERAAIGAATPQMIAADVLALVLAALGRAMVMENSVGITQGHEQLRLHVEGMLDLLEPRRSDDPT